MCIIPQISLCGCQVAVCLRLHRMERRPTPAPKLSKRVAYKRYWRENKEEGGRAVDDCEGYERELKGGAHGVVSCTLAVVTIEVRG
jgi:hypothetical protein